jgi:radical SAM protein with 4Fe4S-binding SPASM domain
MSYPQDRNPCNATLITIIERNNDMKLSDMYIEMKAINRRLSLLKVLTQDTTILNMPYGVSFQNTLLCNLRCPHCQTHGVEEDRKYFNTIKMSDEMLRRVAHEVLPTADEYLFTVSGEPLASTNFTQLLQEFFPYGAKVELHTNGTLITPEILAVLIPAAKGIHVSIDGATKLMVEATRKGAKYKILMRNIKLLTKTVALLPDKLKPLIYFGCTILGSNIRELPEIVKLASLLEIPRIYGYFVVVYHEHLKNEDVKNYKPLYNYYHEKAVELANRLGVFLCLPLPFEGIQANPHGPMGGDKMIIENYPVDYLKTLTTLDNIDNIDDLISTEAIDSQANKIRDIIIDRYHIPKQHIDLSNIFSLIRNYITLKKMRIYHRKLIQKHNPLLEESIQRGGGEPIKYCESLYKRIYLSPTGEITPCCYIYNPLGNVSDDTVKTIWNGNKYNDFKKQFQSDNPLKECINCHNISYLSQATLYDEINSD